MSDVINAQDNLYGRYVQWNKNAATNAIQAKNEEELNAVSKQASLFDFQRGVDYSSLCNSKLEQINSEIKLQDPNLSDQDRSDIIGDYMEYFIAWLAATREHNANGYFSSLNTLAQQQILAEDKDGDKAVSFGEYFDKNIQDFGEYFSQDELQKLKDSKDILNQFLENEDVVDDLIKTYLYGVDISSDEAIKNLKAGDIFKNLPNRDEIIDNLALVGPLGLGVLMQFIAMDYNADNQYTAEELELFYSLADESLPSEDNKRTRDGIFSQADLTQAIDTSLATFDLKNEELEQDYEDRAFALFKAKQTINEMMGYDTDGDKEVDTLEYAQAMAEKFGNTPEVKAQASCVHYIIGNYICDNSDEKNTLNRVDIEKYAERLYDKGCDSETDYNYLLDNNVAPEDAPLHSAYKKYLNVFNKYEQ